MLLAAGEASSTKRDPVATDEGIRTGTSDYARIGGAPAIRTLVERFHQLVLGDHRLAAVFAGADPAHVKRRQVQLLSQVLGGPAAADQLELPRPRTRERIPHDDFRTVVSYLMQTMVETGVEPSIIVRVGEAIAGANPDLVTA